MSPVSAHLPGGQHQTLLDVVVQSLACGHAEKLQKVLKTHPTKIKRTV